MQTRGPEELPERGGHVGFVNSARCGSPTPRAPRGCAARRSASRARRAVVVPVADHAPTAWPTARGLLLRPRVARQRGRRPPSPPAAAAPPAALPPPPRAARGARRPPRSGVDVPLLERTLGVARGREERFTGGAPAERASRAKSRPSRSCRGHREEDAAAAGLVAGRARRRTRRSPAPCARPRPRRAARRRPRGARSAPTGRTMRPPASLDLPRRARRGGASARRARIERAAGRRAGPIWARAAPSSAL